MIELLTIIGGGLFTLTFIVPYGWNYYIAFVNCFLILSLVKYLGR